jgi:hypothetical protein
VIFQKGSYATRVADAVLFVGEQIGRFSRSTACCASAASGYGGRALAPAARQPGPFDLSESFHQKIPGKNFLRVLLARFRLPEAGRDLTRPIAPSVKRRSDNVSAVGGELTIRGRVWMTR